MCHVTDPTSPLLRDWIAMLRDSFDPPLDLVDNSLPVQPIEPFRQAASSHYGPERTRIASCAPVTAKSSPIPAPRTRPPSPPPPPPPPSLVPTMLGPSSSAIPDRPNRPLVVKCGYENSTRRITFPSAASCRLDSLRTRVGGLVSCTVDFHFRYLWSVLTPLRSRSVSTYPRPPSSWCTSTTTARSFPSGMRPT